MVRFAGRMANMEKSAAVIRKLFGAMNDPDLISFSGGALARESLPVDILRGIADDVLRAEGRGHEALSYGPVMGISDLREVVARELLAPKGVEARMEDIMITTGGLEGMNLMCQVFINPGDIILVESPTFVHCVETFEMFEAKCIGVAMDEDGMVPEDLEAKILRHQPKMVYVIPTFQNPTGRTLSLERRKRIAELGGLYDVIILEDDPYRDLRYNGKDIPPIKAFDRTGHTVLAGTFSKILSPGSRLGYLLAPEEIMEKLFDAKSATNSHTSMLPQILCAEFFRRGFYPAHHRRLCDIHRERRDAMMASLAAFFPKGTKWTLPDGGLFTWVEVPGGLDLTQLLTRATTDPEVRVAYVAGEGFFTEGNGMGRSCMRLSFGAATPAEIRTGMERLGRFLRERLEEEHTGKSVPAPLSGTGKNATDLTFEIIPDEDVEVFRDLCHELMAFQRARAKIAPERFDTMNFDTRMLPTVRGALHNHLILVKDGDDIAGYAYANVAPKENYVNSFATFFDPSTIRRDHVGCLSQLYLREAYRGSGAGSRLFDMCMAWLDRFEDVEDRFIFVSNGNTDAYDFYLRKGYVLSHTILDGFILVLRNRT